MFVCAKKIKGKSYAYLVENKWVHGKVKQESKKYLGKIIELEELNQETKNKQFDFSQSTKTIITQLICDEFEKKGFIFNQTKNILSKEDIIINLSKGKIQKNKKNVVIFINGRYVYGSLLIQLINFFEPESEEDKKGKKLALAFSNAGIFISQDNFIQLYKKMYSFSSTLDY